MNFEKFSSMKELYQLLKSNGTVNTYAEAEKWARENMPKEKYYQGKVLAYLRGLIKEGALDGYVWKDAAGLYQSAGFPDVSIITGGKYFGFEVKRPLLGKPSALQMKTIEAIRAGGGIVEVVSYVSEVEKILRENGALKGGGAYDGAQ